jgi:hypothetical protein
MSPEDLSQSSLFSALENANLVYFDGRLPETALVVAEEVPFIFYFIHNKCLKKQEIHVDGNLDGLSNFTFVFSHE